MHLARSAHRRGALVAAIAAALCLAAAFASGAAGAAGAAPGGRRSCKSGHSGRSCDRHPISSTTSVPTTTRPPRSTPTTTAPRPSTPTTTEPRRVDDGSLGDQATRIACTLLTTAQIAAQFGKPVGPATPTYPYCQWLVGANSFLALDVEPDTTFATATQYVDTLQTVTGLGSRAIIANNRYLYFTQGSTSYWLLWQTPGDFTSLNQPQLVALAHDVLDHDLPAPDLPPPPPGATGPPIYFAGDSTAAGPEWAWWAYHESSTTTRTLAEYQVASGFVVPGYFDWPKHLLAVVAERRPKLVIFMGSANDGQAIAADDAVQPVGSKLWDAYYSSTVGQTMAELVAEGCKVLWIGEPAMQDPQLSADMAVIDSIFAHQASLHPGVVFYNPGVVLNGPGGSYAGSLMINGQLTPVRLDGVHLNTAGSIVLADAIAPIVDRMLGIGATQHTRR
ncbi:MAG TPA: hypothetical protein VMD59_00075 [Acidimicrobiales bacterium]|nr:hypothetical protein [Acidimicrobiales bacterium]